MEIKGRAVYLVAIIPSNTSCASLMLQMETYIKDSNSISDR
jgi:hypothetical protein